MYDPGMKVAIVLYHNALLFYFILGWFNAKLGKQKEHKISTSWRHVIDKQSVDYVFPCMGYINPEFNGTWTDA